MRCSVLSTGALICLWLIAGCADSTGPEATGFVIRGAVLDDAGHPVVDAAIVLDLDFASEGLPVAEKPRTTIVFDLPSPSRYELRITDVCDEEVIYACSDSAVAPGEETLVWDARDLAGRMVVEGLYHVHLLVSGAEPVVSEIAVARNLGGESGDFAAVDCVTVREQWRVEAWTDREGRFVIDRDCWEFGHETIRSDEQGNPVGRLVVEPRVRAWAYPPSGTHGGAGAWATVDPDTGANLLVVLTTRS